MDRNPSQPIGTRLGDFELVRELGHGGMGVVYEARQVSLNRRVALKVLRAGLGLTAQAIARFRREAETAAMLHHTNIVPIYATGEENGAHFYAMELIDGPSLDQVIRLMRPQTASGGPRMSDSTSSLAPHTHGSSEFDQTDAYVAGSASAAVTPGPDSSSIASSSQHFDRAAKLIADVADALDYAHRQGVIHRDIKPSNLLLSPDGRLSINDFGLARM